MMPSFAEYLLAKVWLFGELAADICLSIHEYAALLHALSALNTQRIL